MADLDEYGLNRLIEALVQSFFSIFFFFSYLIIYNARDAQVAEVLMRVCTQ